MNTYTKGQKVLITLNPDEEMSDYLTDTVPDNTFEGVYVRRSLSIDGIFPHRVEYTDKNGHGASYLFADDEVSAA